MIQVDTEECWLFAGYKDEFGYGNLFTYKHGKSGRVRAHRASYESFVGEIPSGLVIDHLCRVRHCINPDHLEPVTSRENTLRGEGTLRNKRKICCPKGHEYSNENTYIHPSTGDRYCILVKQNGAGYMANSKTVFH